MFNLLTTANVLKPAMRRALIVAGLLLLPACASIKNEVYIPSENVNSRVRIIVIHHTSSNFAESVNILTKTSSRPVSSHYLIPDPGDPSYTQKQLKVYKLVPETLRAWHAGVSYWAGKTGLNDQSIGIEVVNQTYCTKNPEDQSVADTPDAPGRICYYPDFSSAQIELLIGLLHDILKRHPEIKMVNIIGHSDIAPDRKIDPGPRFPWQLLFQRGIGAWFDDATVTGYWQKFRHDPVPLLTLQKALGAYGYKITASGVMDQQTHDVLRAFQMHFRPMEVTGRPNLNSTAILFALLEKYRPGTLNGLLDAAQESQ